jgi:hypothetical protein
MNMRFSFAVAALAIVCTGIETATAQNFPTRTITMVVPFAAGGTTDVTARIVGEHMSRIPGPAGRRRERRWSRRHGRHGPRDARQSGWLHHRDGTNGDARCRGGCIGQKRDRQVDADYPGCWREPQLRKWMTFSHFSAF